MKHEHTQGTELAQRYSLMSRTDRRSLRERYVKAQNGLCYWCKEPLADDPPDRITNMPINWRLFPPNFLNYPVHLQHDRFSDMTEGVVHAYCNAVMWQYHWR